MATTKVIDWDKVGGGIKRKSIFLEITFILPVAVLFLLVIMAIFAPLLAPYPYDQISMQDRLLPPFFMDGGTTAHLLGTDNIGRDILSRVIYGAQISLSISLIVIAITASIGTVLGILAGYLGGRTDAFLMRVTDISLSFPAILIAILMAVTIGPGYWTVVLAISMLGWAPYARLIRGEALKLRESDFVAQARIIGASPVRIMFRHIFPNVLNPLIVMVTLSVGFVILTEAALSYLGAGIPPPAASWGNMVNDGRTFIDTAWWMSLFPGIVIGLVVLAGNFLGDWLRDKMDPRLRQL
ncbi:MAG: ABC transporter permease [Dehalococcoidales bacterium]|nr:ABC transporter permease [Dehalococcoidales bacterium]